MNVSPNFVDGFVLRRHFGAQYGRRKVTETSVIELCYLNENLLLLSSDTEINTSSTARTVHLAK